MHMTRAALSTATLVVTAALTMTGCFGDDPHSATSATTTAPTTVPEVTTTTTTHQGTSTTNSPRPARFSALGSSRLRFFAECPDLLSYMQEQALKRVTSWGLSGGPWNYYGGGPGPMMEAAKAAGAAAVSAIAHASAPARPTGPSHSGTNTQEAGRGQGHGRQDP